MNRIQIIDKFQNKGIIQMLWSGTVSLHMIRLSLTELNRILSVQPASVNLVITVDASTRLPDKIHPADLPYVSSHNLRGWMVVGNDRQLNRTITDLMHYLAPKSTVQTTS